MYEVRDGAAAKTNQGKASPNPIIKRTLNRIKLLPDNANAVAVPTNGAEQGVARIVASIPERKSFR